MAAVAAAAAVAADQSGLYAYMMQSTGAASLLHCAQYPYSRPTAAPLSLQSSCSSPVALAAVAAAASSPLSYLAASTVGRHVALPTANCSDQTSMDYDAVCGSLMSMVAARQRAVLAAAAASTTTRTTLSVPPSTTVTDSSSVSTSLFRPYQSLSVGVASD